jgi:hypothetical protein
MTTRENGQQRTLAGSVILPDNRFLVLDVVSGVLDIHDTVVHQTQKREVQR